MHDSLIFISTILFAFSGFTLALYGILAQERIDSETRLGMSKGYGFDTDEDNAYFASKYNQWRTGYLFTSRYSTILGFVIVICGSLINLIGNSWWTVPLTIVIGYIVYLNLAKLFKWLVQIISLISIAVGLIFMFI